MKTRGLQIPSLLLSALLLTACGDDAFEGTADNGGNTGGTGDGNGDTTTETLRIGSGTGDQFSEGSLSISIVNLSAGGTSTVSANIVDSQGNLSPTTTEVSFNSSCVALGMATITSPISTSTGTATATYEAKGCQGDDVITARAVLDSQVATATGTLSIANAELGGIQYVTASPKTVAIKGMGGNETTVVSFKIVDSTGSGIANVPVDLSLSNTTGGLQFSNGLGTSSATSDQNGEVRAIVNSGTVHTTFKVQASTTLEGITVTTVSAPIAVSTGIADQDSFDIVADILNPEGWNRSGTEVKITAFASDRFNNPVPDGTSIAFYTEGGQIEPSCTTENGNCSVTWVSSQPRPSKYGAGKVTVYASAVGEESFEDIDGDGRYSAAAGDLLHADLPEAFLDIDNDGVRDAVGDDTDPLEPFLDFNENGIYDGADGAFNGALCIDGCGTASNVHVRDDLVLVMSGSFADISFSTSAVNVTGEGSASFTVRVMDENGNVMPAGTTISITSTVGSVTLGSSHTVSNTNQLQIYYPVTVKGASEPANGSIMVRVTSPNGNEAPLAFIDFNIN